MLRTAKKNQSKWCYISQQVNNTWQLDNKPPKQEIMHLLHTMSEDNLADIFLNTVWFISNDQKMSGISWMTPRIIRCEST